MVKKTSAFYSNTIILHVSFPVTISTCAFFFQIKYLLPNPLIIPLVLMSVLHVVSLLFVNGWEILSCRLVHVLFQYF